MHVRNCFVAIVVGLCLGSACFAQCPERTTAYWTLDETVAGAYADRVGGNAGVCGETCPRSVPLGRVNGGQEFDGETTEIVVPAFPGSNWESNADFSLEFDFWKSGDTLSGREILLGRADDEAGLLWWIGLEADGAVVAFLGFASSEPVTLRGARNSADGRWHHLALVRNAAEGTLNLYLDLEIAASAQMDPGAAWVSGTAPLRIGGLAEAGVNAFVGVLDELAFYDRALPEEEIGENVLNGLADRRWGYCDDPRTIRIMPLGDSITAGVIDFVVDGETVEIDDIAEDGDFMWGYRQPLFLALSLLGFSVDFVGSLRLGAAAEPAFDLDNEGHPGWAAVEVANSVYGWLSGNPADIVLLHIGTNGLNPTRTVADVETILNEIDRFDPNITVLLAQIINQRIPDANFSLYNANLTALAQNRILKGDKIILVDQENALSYPGDLSDDLHPNASGYQKMARTWFDALLRSPDRPTNQPPVADAGEDRGVREGARVALDGSGSFDTDGGIRSFRWEQVSGTPVVLENADTVRATFVAPGVSTFGLVFRLTVTDSGNRTDADEVLVTVNVAAPPIADAGADREATNGDSVVLDGTGSATPGGVLASYRWEQVSGPPVTLADATAPATGFVAPAVSPEGAVLVFELTVTDGQGIEDSDTVEVRVAYANLPPVADAGADRVATEGATVGLDGSGSVDPDGGIARFEWSQIGGRTVVLSDPTARQPTFVAPPVAGTALVFRLTTTDGEGLTDSDDVQISVNDNGIVGFPEGVQTFYSISGQPMGVTVAGGTLVRLVPIDPASVSDTRNRPDTFRYGLFDLVVRTDAVGGTVQTTFYLPEPAPDGHRWYDISPVDGWRAFGDRESVSPDRTRILVHLTDGGFGDDGSSSTRDRGRIDNLSGLGYVVPPVEQQKEDLIGCFVRTGAEPGAAANVWKTIVFGGLLLFALWESLGEAARRRMPNSRERFRSR